ncbi:hypothetical protein JXA47_02610 [Candidatus Sumerlaeota bacterium]|nr:hypothetical protein [Candidatus Sumerlaeota bacterium]
MALPASVHRFLCPNELTEVMWRRKMPPLRDLMAGAMAFAITLFLFLVVRADNTKGSLSPLSPQLMAEALILIAGLCSSNAAMTSTNTFQRDRGLRARLTELTLVPDGITEIFVARQRIVQVRVGAAAVLALLVALPMLALSPGANPVSLAVAVALTFNALLCCAVDYRLAVAPAIRGGCLSAVVGFTLLFCLNPTWIFLFLSFDRAGLWLVPWLVISFVIKITVFFHSEEISLAAIRRWAERYQSAVWESRPMGWERFDILNLFRGRS